jgi:hypothetical protein
VLVRAPGGRTSPGRPEPWASLIPVLTAPSLEELLITEPSPTPPTGVQPARGRRARARRALEWPRARVRSLFILAEALTAFVVAFGFLAASTGINVNPLVRTGQVSGLAALQFRFAIAGIVLLAVAAAGTRLRPGPGRELLFRCLPAAVAGLATGLMAGGLAVSLHGTPWGLYANQGDAGQLIAWAKDVIAGRALPKTYPPLPVHVIAWIAQITGLQAAYAFKAFEIGALAAFGPIAYLAWRLVMSPLPALVIGTVAAVVLAEPYKPYEEIVLVVFVPVLIRFVQILREAGKHSGTWMIGVGVIFGVGLGLLFEVYFGWFYWSVLGAAAAILLTFPWRQAGARLPALAYLGAAAATFVLTTIENLPALALSGYGRDSYFYFDVYTTPTYFLHWFNDTPPANGTITPWPPLGDLGGVALFVVLLFAGLAVAVAFAHDNSLVIVVGTFVASAWVMRFEIAQHMYATGTVGLWPRTDAQILYGLLVITGFVVWQTARKAMRSDLLARQMQRWRSGAAIAGVLVGALLLFASIGDSTTNTYMPGSGPGLLARAAFSTPELNGSCPEFTIRHGKQCKIPVDHPQLGDLPSG